LDLVVVANFMLITQQIGEPQLAGFQFRFQTAVERAIFGAVMLDGVASHPEGLFVSHSTGLSALLPEQAGRRLENSNRHAAGQSR